MTPDARIKGVKKSDILDKVRILTGVSESTVERALSTLMESGVLNKPRYGHYALTEIAELVTIGDESPA
jgi:DNA-binding IclR family transcriptional regulator